MSGFDPAIVASLTPAQLADATGVAVGTLRAWSARYGFPAGQRLPGGHRRYTEHDVLSVKAVQRLREQGLSMSAAIGQANAMSTVGESSIFATLRRRCPELTPFALQKAALVQLSRAIEDEHLARAGSGLLLGSFQCEHHYRRSERRWRQLARTVSCAVVLADFQVLREPAGGPIEVPIPREHQLIEEWAVIVDSPQAQVCLSARELPAPVRVSDGARSFEVIWSFAPEVVADATAIARSLLRLIAPSVATELPETRHAEAVVQLRLAADVAARAYRYIATGPKQPPATASRRSETVRPH